MRRKEAGVESKGNRCTHARVGGFSDLSEVRSCVLKVCSARDQHTQMVGDEYHMTRPSCTVYVRMLSFTFTFFMFSSLRKLTSISSLQPKKDAGSE